MQSLETSTVQGGASAESQRERRARTVDLARALACELLGTLLFQFMGGAAAALAGTHGLIVGAVGNGISLAAAIACFGHVSGGHYNPAVSTALLLAGHLRAARCALYVAAQLLGSVVGAALLYGAMGDSLQFHMGGALTRDCAAACSPGRAVLLEAVGTWLLVSTVLGCAVHKKGAGAVAPVAIGFALVAAACAMGPLTGAAVNPARAWGPSVVYADFTYHWVYWVGPAAGCAVAAAVDRLLLTGAQRDA